VEAKLTQTLAGEFCPVRTTLTLVGQKWVLHIVHELTDGKRRFNELAERVGGCNSRTLRDRLKEPEQVGVVHREIVETNPPWVEYDLTPRGRELAAAMEPLADWGRSHLTDAEAQV
jgi:DNA-binding HxlR family transcriptional regulator